MIKKYNFSYTLFLVFFIQITAAQVNTDLRPAIKSPEVNKFEQYMNMPVNLVSGTPQISIPIYNLSYSGMSLPITLEYDASGVKVEDIASSVGLKWSLNVGGTVSRIIKGAPDEGNPFTSFYEVSQINVNGYYKNNGLSLLNSEITNISSTDPETGKLGQFNRWIVDCYRGLKDSQPDLFYFSTPEGGSKFVFNNQKEVVYLENTDFIIKESLDSYYNTFTWTAKSPNGINYKFGNNNMCEKAYSTQVGSLPDYRYLINSWFLTEVNNSATNDIISITYIDNSYSHVFNNNPIKTTIPCLTNLGNSQSQCNANFGENSYYNFASNPYSTNSTEIMALQNPQYMENHTSSKLISNIKAGKTDINFIYSDRQDLYKDYDTTILPIPKKLDEIDIVVNGLCVKKFIFNYTTYTSDEFTNGMSLERKTATKKRLILNSLTETSCDGTLTKPYVFEYNNPQLLPNRISYAQDKWGYFNGKTDNTSLFPKYNFFQDSTIFADRAVDTLSCRAGSIKKIIYPTKGTVNFEFESNKSNVAVDYKYDTDHPLGTLTSISSTQSATGTYSSVFTYNASVNETLLLKATLSYNPTGSAGCSSSISRAASIVDNVTGVTIAQINYQGLVTSKTILCPIDKNLLVDQRQYTLTVQGYGGTNGMNYMCNINNLSSINQKSCN